MVRPSACTISHIGCTCARSSGMAGGGLVLRIGRVTEGWSIDDEGDVVGLR
jgi:hypothetical protein